MELPLHYGLDLIAWSWREWFFFGLGIASTVVVVMLPFVIEEYRQGSHRHCQRRNQYSVIS
jgi:hypothetical protein